MPLAFLGNLAGPDLLVLFVVFVVVIGAGAVVVCGAFAALTVLRRSNDVQERLKRVEEKLDKIVVR
jgi:hypothetical protein